MAVLVHITFSMWCRDRRLETEVKLAVVVSAAKGHGYIIVPQVHRVLEECKKAVKGEQKGKRTEAIKRKRSCITVS